MPRASAIPPRCATTKPAVFGWRHLVALINLVAVLLFALAVRGVVIDVKLRKAAKTEKKNS